MWGLSGYVGQLTYNSFYAKPAFVVEGPRETFWQRMAKKSWTPFKLISNEEYADMLREKVLKLDVEVAVLEDKIAAMRKQMAEEESMAAKESHAGRDGSHP